MENLGIFSNIFFGIFGIVGVYLTWRSVPRKMTLFLVRSNNLFIDSSSNFFCCHFPAMVRRITGKSASHQSKINAANINRT